MSSTKSQPSFDIFPGDLMDLDYLGPLQEQIDQQQDTTFDVDSFLDELREPLLDYDTDEIPAEEALERIRRLLINNENAFDYLELLRALPKTPI